MTETLEINSCTTAWGLIQASEKKDAQNGDIYGIWYPKGNNGKGVWLELEAPLAASGIKKQVRNCGKPYVGALATISGSVPNQTSISLSLSLFLTLSLSLSLFPFLFGWRNFG